MRFRWVRRRARWRAGIAQIVGTLLVSALALSGAGCRRPRTTQASAPVTVTALDPGYGALRADFVRDAGHPRLLVVVSPT